MALLARNSFGRCRSGAVALIAAALAAAGCGTGDHDHAEHDGPRVVATTSWEAAFARAAGATDVTVIVPSSIKHAPDYDPKPSDLAAVTEADFVLYARFEGFAGKITEAAGSAARTVAVNLDNSRAAVVAEVQRLGDLFGTRAAADTWLHDFGGEYDRLAAEVRAAWRDGRAPKVLTQAFTGFAAELSGAEVLGTYGPEPVTARQVAALSALHPQYVLANEQMDTGTVLPGIPATQITLTNYPTHDDDLRTVYRDAAAKITAALRK